MNAADLAALLRTTIFDLEDAAARLGIDTTSLWAAVYRRRIAFVQYRTHKYFAVSDLDAYAQARAPGLASEIERCEAYEIVGAGLDREVRVLPRSR